MTDETVGPIEQWLIAHARKLDALVAELVAALDEVVQCADERKCRYCLTSAHTALQHAKEVMG